MWSTSTHICVHMTSHCRTLESINFESLNSTEHITICNRCKRSPPCWHHCVVGVHHPPDYSISWGMIQNITELDINWKYIDFELHQATQIKYNYNARICRPIARGPYLPQNGLKALGLKQFLRGLGQKEYIQIPKIHFLGPHNSKIHTANKSAYSPWHNVLEWTYIVPYNDIEITQNINAYKLTKYFDWNKYYQTC